MKDVLTTRQRGERTVQVEGMHKHMPDSEVRACYGGFAPLDKEQHSGKSKERPSGLHVKNTTVTAQLSS